jgi:hypothetical protein
MPKALLAAAATLRPQPVSSALCAMIRCGATPSARPAACACGSICSMKASSRERSATGAGGAVASGAGAGTGTAAGIAAGAGAPRESCCTSMSAMPRPLPPAMDSAICWS